MTLPVGFVTLSHRSDLERCELLFRSIDRHVSPRPPHYLIVDRRDRHLFRHLQTKDRTILCVEEVLPWWVFRLPLVPGVWFSLRSRPFRDWILQQLVKLAVPMLLPEEVLIHIDTDVAFVRSFDPGSFVKDGQVRLFRVPGANPTTHFRWHRAASRLLGLPLRDYHGASYVGNLVSWRRGNVEGLHAHIERATGRHWLRAACAQWHLAEYLLYGVYVEHVLGIAHSGHYCDATNPCLGFWEWRSLSESEVREFLAQIGPEHVAVMIASYSGTPVRNYQHLVGLG